MSECLVPLCSFLLLFAVHVQRYSVCWLCHLWLTVSGGVVEILLVIFMVGSGSVGEDTRGALIDVAYMLVGAFWASGVIVDECWVDSFELSVVFDVDSLLLQDESALAFGSLLVDGFGVVDDLSVSRGDYLSTGTYSYFFIFF